MAIAFFYRIYDMNISRYMTEYIKAGAVSKLTGINQSSVSKYADDGTIYKKRYKIEKKKVSESEIFRMELSKMSISDLRKYWDSERLRINPNACITSTWDGLEV